MGRNFLFLMLTQPNTTPGIRCSDTRPRSPRKSLEIIGIHGNHSFQLIGGGPGGGDRLARNRPESDAPTLDLEILGNPTKSMEILRFS